MWNIHLGHTVDSRTKLVIVCANERCVEERRVALGASHDDFIVWDEFDITGQTEHHDTQPTEINGETYN
jgi:hypothetical protein